MEPLFNDRSLFVSAPCSMDALILSRVDANSTPTDHRPAELLRRKGFEARAYFTRVYDNWSVSGQNDSEKFSEFVKGPVSGSSKYPYLSMCAINLFNALRCGRSDADEEILRLYVKTAPTGVMYDDYVEEVDEISELQTPARGSSKRTRRIENGGTSEPLQTLAALVPSVEQVGQCMSRILSSEEAIGRGKTALAASKKQRIPQESTRCAICRIARQFCWTCE
jgi:hypothetical protein